MIDDRVKSTPYVEALNDGRNFVSALEASRARDLVYVNNLDAIRLLYPYGEDTTKYNNEMWKIEMVTFSDGVNYPVAFFRKNTRTPYGMSVRLGGENSFIENYSGNSSLKNRVATIPEVIFDFESSKGEDWQDTDYDILKFNGNKVILESDLVNLKSELKSESIKKVIKINTNHIVLSDNDYIIGDSSTKALTVTLRDATIEEVGKVIFIKNVGANGITVNTVKSQTINGESSKVLTNDQESVKIFSDGTSYHIY